MAGVEPQLPLGGQDDVGCASREAIGDDDRFVRRRWAIEGTQPFQQLPSTDLE